MSDSVIGSRKLRGVERPQHARLKHILERIREGTRTGRYPNASVLASEMEVSWRTVIRDLDWLRVEEGAPIEYNESRKGFHLSDPTWVLPPVQLNRKELFAFSIAAKLLGSFRGTPLEMDMASVLGKIAESMQGSMTFDLGAMTDRFTVVGEDYVKQDPAVWVAVAGFLERHEQMQVTYVKFDGTVREYVLEPYHLLAYHGNWYVLARHTEKDTPATFALSRIRRFAGTGVHFTVPASFDPKEHVDKAFGIVRGGKVMKVRLLFSKSIATYIRERVWHPSQKMIERRDGRLELRMETAGWKELVRWILSWQPDVKVLAPAALRERVREKMAAGMKEGGNAEC